ncbi:hypothetical protein HC251_15630 [Iamia sp. SCSIO 61187]|uniref:hypothetical protein n=1 Tax=Iamia sp. SCSIO 61187 TaxID=2722752 RepID=UPI001C62CAB0|nr:hypothetical protein [Iamia sp. SCSIO 61187]QYG93713.1 hypothetical protein HC251_15630 [Iamia sp. SCSIO 61187]
MDDRTRLSYQAALMAMSAWVLGTLLLGVSFRVVGLGGIAVLLVTLVAVRLVDLGDE